MPSFDVVSEVDSHELVNAVDQANRELNNRFDFKGSASKIELDGHELKLKSDSEYRIKQMHLVLYEKMGKRGIDINCLEKGNIDESLNNARQKITIRHGLDKEAAKQITKMLKESKLKVQAAIQGEQVRVTGKKRDDLQEAIAMLKQAKLDLPLQFTNFRD